MIFNFIQFSFLTFCYLDLQVAISRWHQLPAQVLYFSNVPVVAIGGIFPEDIHHVIEAGARNVALVRHYMQTHEFDKRVQDFKLLLKRK